MDDTVVKSDPIELVIGALRAFGDLTAAAIAEKTGMAYSTVTPKLRTLEGAGRAERVRANGRTFWRATAPEQATAASADAASDTDDGDTMGAPASEVGTTTTTEPTVGAEPLPTAPAPASADDRHRAGPDAQATTEPADGADGADAAPADSQAPDPAPTAAASEPAPATAAPGGQAGHDGAPALQPATESAPATTTASEKTRRPPGELDRTALRIMQGNPDRPYKVTELARLIDQLDAADGHNYPKASPGAVVLACDRLVDRGDSTKVGERPALYQCAAAQPVNP